MESLEPVEEGACQENGENVQDELLPADQQKQVDRTQSREGRVQPPQDLHSALGRYDRQPVETRQ